MASELSTRARRVLRGLLAGESLTELARPGTSVHGEVAGFLAAAAGDEKKAPAKSRPARPPKGDAVSAVAYSDGASRGNPGPAAYGIRILADDGTEIAAEGARIGRTTNNVAEYRGAIAVLEKALSLGIREIELRLDSELVVKQLNGQYRVKHPALAELKEQVDRLIGEFTRFRVRHVRREKNSETDRLANEALDAS